MLRDSKSFQAVRDLFWRIAAVRCYTVATDKLQGAGGFANGASALVEAGRADSASNLFGQLIFNAVSGHQRVNFYYGETAPTGEYANAPIGSVFLQFTQSAGAITAATWYIKGSGGWSAFDDTAPRDGTIGRTAVSVTTAGAGTYSAANIASGFIVRDPAGASRTDTTGTAAAIVAALGGVAGTTYGLTVVNVADADEVITLAGGSGVTLAPSVITIKANQAKLLGVRLVNVTSSSEAVTIYDLTPDGGFVSTGAHKTVVSTVTSGSQTLTTAQLLGGYLRHDCGGGAANLTTPTATQIVAAIPNCQVGSSFECVMENISDGAETATLVAGTDVTLATGMVATTARTYASRYLFVVTGVGTPGVSVYKVGYSVSNGL